MQVERVLPKAALNLILVIMCAGLAAAQNEPVVSVPPGSVPRASAPQASAPQASAPQASPSPVTTRVRRAAQDSPEKTPTEKPPVTPAEAPETNSEPEPEAESSATPKSEAMTLRDEIDAAPNAQERSRLQLKLVDHLVAAGMKQEAIAELHLLSAEDHFDPQAFYNIANAFARLGATDSAIKAYRKAIEQRKGRYSRASNNLGVVLLRQGFWDQAYDAFLSALRQESFRYAEASYNLGRLYAARGQIDLAIVEWRRAVAVDPSHAAAAGALARAGSTGSITVAPTRPGIRSVGGATPPAGRQTSPRGATIDPLGLTVDPETYKFLQRGRTARERGRNEDAVDSYKRVISRMGGYFAPANLEISYALISLKRHDEAVAALLAVTQRDGARYPISYYHLARLYELRGDLQQAENNYRQAADSYSGNNTQFLLDLSRVREKRGDLPGALAALEQYVKTEEQKGQKPEWSDERIALLRQKLAASPNQPKQ